MLLLSVLVCFFSLLKVSLSTPILAEKPQPMELKYVCIPFTPAEHQKIRHDNVPIIALHGLGETKESWRGVAEALAEKTKKEVCVVDLRNHGESPWNNIEYNVEAMTEDIRHLIDELEVEKAIVLGHSLGGKLAIHLALNYPERVEKIIVEDARPNTISPEGLEEARIYFKMLKDLEKDIPQGVSEIEAKKEFLKIFNKRLEEINVFFILDANAMPIKCSDGKCQWSFNPILRDAFLDNPSYLLTKSFGRFDGPALFIYGGKSNYKVGEDEVNIKKLFPHAKLVEVAESYHTVHTSKKFLREVVKFINDEKEEKPC